MSDLAARHGALDDTFEIRVQKDGMTPATDETALPLIGH
jgi:hypothetical protein